MISNLDTRHSQLTYAFLFDCFAVTIRQWIGYSPGGDERGAHFEIQRLEPHPAGSEDAGVPVARTDPVWWADVFTLISGAPGNFDSAHCHPNFCGLEPSDRHWADTRTADQVASLSGQLTERLDEILVTGGAPDLAGGPEVPDLQATVPDILERVRRGMSPAPLTPGKKAGPARDAT